MALVIAGVVTAIIALPYLAVVAYRTVRQRRQTGAFPHHTYFLKHVLILGGIFLAVFLGIVAAALFLSV